MRWGELYRCLFDALMVVWFFLPLKEGRNLSPVKRSLCFLLLLSTAPIYVMPGGGQFVVALSRFAFRTAIYTLWLRLRKGVLFRESLYYGILCWIAFTAQNNIFLTPQLSFLRWNQVTWSALPLLDQIINVAVELAAEFGILTLVSRTFPFQDVRPFDRSRFVIVGVVVICELYVKSTLKTISEALPDAYTGELTIYPILLQSLLIIALVLLERHLSAQSKQEQQRLNEVATRYRYESAQARVAAETDLRQLHHDMKHHLLGLQQLAGDNEKLERYIDQLLQRTKEYETLVDTGNPLLDGLLSEKIRQADRENIDLTVMVDIRQGEFLTDMDLCAIFGNALDNAIEASRKVADPEKRSILVKCSTVAKNLVLTVINYYEGTLNRSGDLFLSDKAAPGHGLGLASIRHTVEKYGGVLRAETDGYHNFIITILIPISSET